MIKKAGLALVLTVIIGLLVYGAWYRTNFKLTGEMIPPGLGTTGIVGTGQEQEGSGGQGGGWGSGARTAVNLEWVTLEGTVAAVDSITVTIATPDGTPVTLENRPWQYALSAGFSAKAGDTLKLTGFYETPGAFTTARIQNLTTNANVVLRDTTGRPMWSGRGGGG